MNESVYQVAEALKEALPKYKENHVPVVARIHGIFDGKADNYWFIVGDSNRSLMSMPDVREYGHLVSRNSLIATKILNNEIGADISYQKKNDLHRLVDHHIKATSKADIERQEIRLWGDTLVYLFKDIDSFLEELRKNQHEIEETKREIELRKQQIEELKKQENTAHERSVLTRGLNKLEEERRILTQQQEDLSNLTNFIRQQGKLRFNPILDPVQNKIKTQNLFDGRTIVIDGGPGTGKTTTMIQRLKYLTDLYAIGEDFENGTNLYKLSAAQRDHLDAAIKEDRDWMFFSPSKLLKEYLSDAMNREGLKKTNEKVWYWDEYRNKIMREYYQLIIPTDENSPFKSSRSTETLFLDNMGIIYSLSNYFIDTFKQIKTKFPKIEEQDKKYLWMSIAQNIKQRFDNCDDYTLQDFVRLFYSLNQTYGRDCQELLSENREKVNKIADEIYLLSKENNDIYEKLVSLASSQSTEATDDETEETENVENDSDVESGINGKIISMIQTWLKRYCYSIKNKDIRLTARQENLSELLLPILLDEHKLQIERIGELVLFEQYAKYTRGIRINVLSGFVTKYKRFRRQALTRKDKKWNLIELESLLKRREGKELHPQEQSLIIGFINNLVKMVIKTSNDTVKHDFVTAYKELTRPIIGVDEATDFCECDMYAMQSLLYNDYNSLTLCGDLMQRLTAIGIHSWDELKPVLSSIQLVEMRTSYRQSASLLKVAKALYKDSIGEEPNYKAYMKSTKVPEPLAFVSSSESSKIDWIEKRINEVYVAYGKRLPSIAIFLNRKEDIGAFVAALRDTDFIYDSGIEIVDGSDANVLASSNQIRVYPIDAVKGMEFDVVFFHNIDNAVVDNDLIKRYIYVGVSRAAFFLGATFTKEVGNDDVLKYFDTSLEGWSIIKKKD